MRMQAATAGIRLKQIRWEWLGGTCEDAGNNSVEYRTISHDS